MFRALKLFVLWLDLSKKTFLPVFLISKTIQLLKYRSNLPSNAGEKTPKIMWRALVLILNVASELSKSPIYLFIKIPIYCTYSSKTLILKKSHVSVYVFFFFACLRYLDLNKKLGKGGGGK